MRNSLWETRNQERKKAFSVAATDFHLATKMHGRMSSMLCFQFRQFINTSAECLDWIFPLEILLFEWEPEASLKNKYFWNLFVRERERFLTELDERAVMVCLLMEMFLCFVKVRSISWQLRHGKMKMLWENEMLWYAPIDSRPSW